MINIMFLVGGLLFGFKVGDSYGPTVTSLSKENKILQDNNDVLRYHNKMLRVMLKIRNK